MEHRNGLLLEDLEEMKGALEQTERTCRLLGQELLEASDRGQRLHTQVRPSSHCLGRQDPKRWKERPPWLPG